MTDQATRIVPAGWYQDPAMPDQVRWWNGLAWTEHVREKPGISQQVTAAGAAAAAAAHGVTIRTTAETAGTAQPSETAETTETTEQRIAAVRDLERQFGIGTSENEIITPAAAASAASASVAQPGAQGSIAATTGPATGNLRAAARTATGSAWLIALSPVLALVLAIAAAYIYFYVYATPIVFAVALVLPFLLAILWALGDGRALSARGFHPPSPAFALLTGLGYLIVRRIRVPGSGPLAMLLVLGVLAFGSFPAMALSGQLNGVEDALNIQHTISADYIAHGEAVSVSCPAFVDASTTGSLYTCDATTAIGTTREIWVSIDGGGKFSYALAV